MLTIKAFAKLNLTLEVLGDRPDGYHEIASVMQTVSLADTLTIEQAPEFRFSCSDPTLETPDNLVVKAARFLDPEGRRGAAVHLRKGIPAAAGLGGGSSDAAAALFALSKVWEMDVPEQEIGSLGSDVPFFWRGGTAVASGRGDHVDPLPAPKECWFLILHPHVALPGKTRTLYGQIGREHWTQGRVTDQLAVRITAGRPIREAYLHNAFDAVAFDLLPELHDWRRRLLEEIANRPHLAGSGPSLFIPVADEAEGWQVATAIQAHPEGPDGADFFVVRTVPDAREVC